MVSYYRDNSSSRELKISYKQRVTGQEPCYLTIDIERGRENIVDSFKLHAIRRKMADHLDIPLGKLDFNGDFYSGA